MLRSATRCFAAALFVLALPASAATVIVTIPGPLDERSSVGCGLFAGERGFPMERRHARTQWLAAHPSGVTCVFPDVADGTYAVSVLLDLNGNGRVDTNPFGIPIEPWGVSNNVRPALRAPQFSEAAFHVSGGGPVAIHVRLQH
jgi:uncharacterized protein (DUF2141 family)